MRNDYIRHKIYKTREYSSHLPINILNMVKVELGSIPYNTSDVLRHMNELIQQGQVEILDHFHIVGSSEGWTCQPFRVHHADSAETVEFKPANTFTTKKKAKADAYKEVIDYFCSKPSYDTLLAQRNRLVLALRKMSTMLREMQSKHISDLEELSSLIGEYDQIT